MTVTEIISYIDSYLQAIQEIREKQLKILYENVGAQNDFNEVEIWNNEFALFYIEQRYTILKQALSLLSDSRQHIWLTLGNQTRKNAYEPLINPILSEFDTQNITQSLEQLWEKMAANDFQKEIIRLKQKISTEQTLFALSLTTAALFAIALMITGMIFGIAIHSFALYMCAAMIPIMGTGCLFVLSSAIYSIVTGKPLYESAPIPFKQKIAEQFTSLEQAFKTEMEQNLTFSESKCRVLLSKAHTNTSGKELTLTPPLNFEKQQSRKALYERFNGSIFNSSSEGTCNSKTLKQSVEEAYDTLPNTARPIKT